MCIVDKFNQDIEKNNKDGAKNNQKIHLGLHQEIQ